MNLLAAFFIAMLALQDYRDTGGRFVFSFPAEWGETSPGTNSGFGDRVAAIRFSRFSSGVRDGAIVLGGEAVVTKGRVTVDLQAVGGLYDSIALEAFPDAMRAKVVGTLPALSAQNFCEQLGKAQHLPGSGPVADLDRMRNVDPVVHRCEREGDVVVFDKESGFRPAQPQRQHVYGAVRFLTGVYSSFQIVRATAAPPSADTLAAIAAAVKSFH
jgi:hypothetical protein